MKAHSRRARLIGAKRGYRFERLEDRRMLDAGSLPVAAAPPPGMRVVGYNVSIADITVGEGKQAELVVTRTPIYGPSGGQIIVQEEPLHFTTVSGTAIVSQDYVGKSGDVFFPTSFNSDGTLKITISTSNDLEDEPNQTFSVLLRSARLMSNCQVVHSSSFAV